MEELLKRMEELEKKVSKLESEMSSLKESVTWDENPDGLKGIDENGNTIDAGTF